MLTPTDIGGGNVPYKTPHALSRIPFRWVVREAIECGSSIVWDRRVLEQWKVEKPKTAQELAWYVEQERSDALSEQYSAYAWNNAWWALELVPRLKEVTLFGYATRVPWCVKHFRRSSSEQAPEWVFSGGADAPFDI